MYRKKLNSTVKKNYIEKLYRINLNKGMFYSVFSIRARFQFLKPVPLFLYRCCWGRVV